jgi:hypothetical protein
MADEVRGDERTNERATMVAGTYPAAVGSAQI